MLVNVFVVDGHEGDLHETDGRIDAATSHASRSAQAKVESHGDGEGVEGHGWGAVVFHNLENDHHEEESHHDFDKDNFTPYIG